MYLPTISENTGAISDNPSERVSSVECSGLPHSPIEENPKKEKTFIFTWGQVDSARKLCFPSQTKYSPPIIIFVNGAKPYLEIFFSFKKKKPDFPPID